MSTDEPRERLAQNDMFPPEARFIEKNIKPYITLITYMYGVEYPKTLRYSPRGRTSYSHIALEKWILATPNRTHRYVSLLADALEEYYLKRRKRGDRCMIFVSLVKMADALVKHLHIRFNSKYEMDIINYTGSLKKEELTGKDIIISTIGKAGTALDIIGLTTLINSVAVSKIETARQNIQRLRRPKNVKIKKYHNYMDDVDRIAVQIHNVDIPAHANYARNRARSIKKLIVKHETVNSNVRL